MDTQSIIDDKEERLKNLRKSNATLFGWIIVLILVIAGLTIGLVVTNLKKERKLIVSCNGLEQTDYATYIGVTIETDMSTYLYASEFALKINNLPMETAEYIVKSNTASSKVFGDGTYKVEFTKKIILPGDTVQLYFRGNLIATL